MYCVYVTIHVVPDRIDDFIAATRANHQATRQEPGNHRFDVLRDHADEQQFYLYEVYDSPEAFAAHQQTAHYATWKATVADMMARPRAAAKSHTLFPDPWT